MVFFDYPYFAQELKYNRIFQTHQFLNNSYQTINFDSTFHKRLSINRNKGARQIIEIFFMSLYCENGHLKENCRGTKSHNLTIKFA